MGRLATCPSRILTCTQSMNSTGYTASNGRLCQAAIPSITFSVMTVMVCLDTSAPYTSRKWAAISPCVSPLADSEITRSSTPDSRRCRLATICGVKLESRSRGTSISIGPMSLSTVLTRVPLRELPPSRDRKSTRLNSSHVEISYAVFCLKKKKKKPSHERKKEKENIEKKR